MFDILQYIPRTARKSPSGWWTFNAPCCIHNGETADKRKRGGLILDGNNWSYHCFNCGFKTRFVMGQTLSRKTRKFMEWIGVDSDTINKVNLESIKNKPLLDRINEQAKKEDTIILRNVHFKEYKLPADARRVTIHDKKFSNYLRGRGLTPESYDFYITPHGKARNRNRLIVPYSYAGENVGWTSRYLDADKPKYRNEHQQPGFVFGLDDQDPDWKHLLVMEGIFDAISIGGAAVLHNEINEQQAALLRRQGKNVIVVPDQDYAGLKIVEDAERAGFSVSVPHWPTHVKDVNDAVLEYGRAGALLSILLAATSNKIKIQMAIKRGGDKFVKAIRL